MKILVLNYEYPPIGGGAGNQTLLINESLASLNNEVFLITSHFHHLPYFEYKSNYSVFRIPVFRKKAEKSRFIEMLFYLMVSLPLAIYLIVKERPNVIHAHFILPCGILAIFLKKMFRIKVVITAHGGDVPSHQPEQTKDLFRFFKPFAQYVIKNADQIHAVSKGIDRKIRNDFAVSKDKIKIIPNSVKFQIINSKKQAPFKFLFLGRISPEKNLDFILDCLKEVHSDFEFYIVGSGEDKKLKEKVYSSELKEKVLFTGWLNKTEVEAYLKKCHYLILHSSSEGLPMAGLEANMYGLPVIGSDIEGIRDFITEGINGFMTPLKDKKSFIDMIEQLCGKMNDYESLSYSSKQYIKTNFELSGNIKKFVLLLQP